MRAWVWAYLPNIIRVFRSIKYTCLAVAGGWLMSTPTELLQSTMGKVVYGWALFLLIGGILCGLGTITKLWIGEFCGLVLLFVANVAWGITLMNAGHNSAKYGLVLLGWSSGFVVRELEIYKTIRTAAKIGRRRRKSTAEGGGLRG